jgi:hypothetical protein
MEEQYSNILLMSVIFSVLYFLVKEIDVILSILLNILLKEYVEGFFRNENKKFSDKFIYSCDVSENNITFGKKSNLKYEVLVKPIEVKQFDDYTEDMTELSNTLSSGLSRIMMEHQFEVC